MGEGGKKTLRHSPIRNGNLRECNPHKTEEDNGLHVDAGANGEKKGEVVISEEKRGGRGGGCADASFSPSERLRSTYSRERKRNS